MGAFWLNLCFLSIWLPWGKVCWKDEITRQSGVTASHLTLTKAWQRKLEIPSIPTKENLENTHGRQIFFKVSQVILEVLGPCLMVINRFIGLSLRWRWITALLFYCWDWTQHNVNPRHESCNTCMLNIDSNKHCWESIQYQKNSILRLINVVLRPVCMCVGQFLTLITKLKKRHFRICPPEIITIILITFESFVTYEAKMLIPTSYMWSVFLFYVVKTEYRCGCFHYFLTFYRLNSHLIHPKNINNKE